MECPKCKTANPDGKRFCGDCGISLDPVDDEFRRKVQAIVREQLRDQKMVEIETADAVLARLKTMAKPFLYAAGVIFAVLGVLGFRSLRDVMTAVGAAQQQAVQALKSQAQTESQSIAREAQSIREQYRKVGDQQEIVQKLKDAETQLSAIQADEKRLRDKVRSSRDRYEQTSATLAQMQADGASSETATTRVGSTKRVGMPAAAEARQDSSPRYYGPSSHGPAVERIQQRLVALGCYGGPVSGEYDDATMAAVLRFNRLRGDPLEARTVDPDTYQALFDKGARCR